MRIGLIITTIIVLLIILYNYFKNVGIKTNNDPHTYFVSGGFANRDMAAKRMSEMNSRLMKLLRHLRNKYAGKAPKTDKEMVVAAMLFNYNPERLFETDPRFTNDTSYTIGKGEVTKMCLREKTSPDKFVDFNTLMFVALHELSHMGAYDVQGHPDRFWQIFKFVLTEAIEAGGIYKPIDYERHPIDYCGLRVDYNPYYDDAMMPI